MQPFELSGKCSIINLLLSGKGSMIGYLILILIFAWIVMGRRTTGFKVLVSVVIVLLFLFILTARGGLDRYELIDLLLSF